MRALSAPRLCGEGEFVHAGARQAGGGATRLPTAAGSIAAVRAALTASLAALGALEADAGDSWIDSNSAPVPARAIRDAVRRGELRASRVAKRLLVRRSELDAWIEAHTVARQPAPARPATLLDRLGRRAPAEGGSP